jgi:hypothetical protein
MVGGAKANEGGWWWRGLVGGWVGKGHGPQVGPPLVSIYGMRDPIEGEKRGSDKEGGLTVGGEKGKRRGEGVAVG